MLRSYLEYLAQPLGNPSEQPQKEPLAWMREDGSEYIAGGRWRHRSDIGEIRELSAGSTSAAEELLERLLTAYREDGYDLVLLGFGEQDRARSFYTRRGFVALEDVTYFSWRAQPIPASPPGLTALTTLRPFEPDDLDAVIAVDHAAFPWIWWNSYSEMRWYARMPDVEIWVLADAAGTIIGYSGSTGYGDKGHLDRLAIHPDVQGRGYGGILLGNALKRLVAQGALEVSLSTQQDNRRSQRLYSRYGFRHTGIRFHLYGRWVGEPPTEQLE